MNIEELIDFCVVRENIHRTHSRKLKERYEKEPSEMTRIKYQSALNLSTIYMDMACALNNNSKAKFIDSLKSEIKNIKKKQESPNMDYYTGYMSALSAVEGVIAILEGNNENERGTNDNQKQSEDGSETVG